MQRKPDESEEGEELREEAIFREKSINPLNHRSLLNLEHFVKHSGRSALRSTSSSAMPREATVTTALRRTSPTTSIFRTS